MKNKHYIIPIFVPHEGCPHNCVFCNQNIITGKEKQKIKIDGNYAKKIIDDYLDTMDKHNSIIEVSFFGGTFTAIEKSRQIELLAVAKEYKTKGAIDFIRLSTRPDYIDDEILTYLKEYGVDIIELGVQSLDEQVLKLSGRGHTADHVVNASKLIKKYNITLGHQIMIGLPGDSFEKDIQTVKKVIDLKPSLCRIYPALIIRNTPMEKMYEEGVYTPYSLEEAIEITKKLYIMLSANDINIIRIGLQPTAEINWGADLIQGPFHPAFRELVESSLLNDMLIYYLKSLEGNYKEVSIIIGKTYISRLYANKKHFFNDMLKQVYTIKVNVFQSEQLKDGEIVIEYGEKSNKILIDDYIKNAYIKRIS